MLQIEYSQDNTVVFGGMFFQEFYGFFANQYSDNGSEAFSTSATLFVSETAAYDTSYVGAEVLPQGRNPFVEPEDDDTSGNGWWIAILLASLLGIGACVGAFFCYKARPGTGEVKITAKVNHSDKTDASYDANSGLMQDQAQDQV
jgi:hypothetical protein